MGVAPEVLAFVRAALPEPPTRVLEVGAGDGELARALRELGYDVLAIDPGASAPLVEPVALHAVDEEPRSFDAAVAVVSLHHVEPLPASCATLAEVVRPGGPLVIDEFDVAAFDQRAARWWSRHRAVVAGHAHVEEPAEHVAELREHLHPLSRIQAELSPYFAFGHPVPGPYLYRWGMPPGLREPEEGEIAAGRLPATGARLVAIRRDA